MIPSPPPKQGASRSSSRDLSTSVSILCSFLDVHNDTCPKSQHLGGRGGSKGFKRLNCEFETNLAI